MHQNTKATHNTCARQCNPGPLPCKIGSEVVSTHERVFCSPAERVHSFSSRTPCGCFPATAATAKQSTTNRPSYIHQQRPRCTLPSAARACSNPRPLHDNSAAPTMTLLRCRCRYPTLGTTATVHCPLECDWPCLSRTPVDASSSSGSSSISSSRCCNNLHCSSHRPAAE
jgi:hypothetical protein